MAAWENMRPKTAVDHGPNLNVDEPATETRQSSKHLKLPIGLLLLVAACGSVALSLDLLDVSLLRTGWSQLLSGIRSLFT
jgi:hypothetical protein